MFDRLLTKPLSLSLGADERKFRCPEQLSLVLGARTAPSPSLMSLLGSMSDTELARETDRIKTMEQQLIHALSQPGHGDSEEFLRHLDPSMVADDNGWKETLDATARQARAAPRLKRVVLARYLEYLHAVQELLRVVRGGGRPAPRDTDPGQTGHGETPLERGPRQRLVFDLHTLENPQATLSDNGAEEFNRLPKGESLGIDFEAHQSLSVMLSRHRFTLVSGTPFLLVDENGADLRLQRGKNIIGRSIHCDVTVDPIFRAISRRHVIVETLDSGAVKLTDISTMGTFVPRAYLDNRLH